MRQMSPACTSCSSSTASPSSATRTVPAVAISNVLSCEPYSSAFCAMSPTFGVVPIVAGSNAPCSRQCSTVSAYSAAYEESGMTNFASCCSPAAFHICPEERIAAGIEASTMTSDGACRFVMALSESTIAIDGPAASADSTASRTSGCAVKRLARPSFGLASSPSNTSSPTTARTAWPKMIGSETFIIVAFRCTEKSTPCALASATCSARKASSAARRMTAASSTSPASTAMPALSTVTVPSPPTCSTRTAPSAATVTDRSVQRKSPPDIVDTWDLESGDHAPIACGCERAKAFADAGARRSELPSRRTGLTALPLTASYLTRTGSAGSSGRSGIA